MVAYYNEELSSKDSFDVVKWALDLFGDQVLTASSFGAEDQVLTDMVMRADSRGRIITLDTGMLFKESYEVMQETMKRYSLTYEVYFPNSEEVEHFTRSKGPLAIYDDVETRKECCRIRKINPLKRALAGAKAWICGLRQEMSSGRNGTALVEWDSQFGLFKINPLYNWSEEQVWNYIREHELPYNRLHDQGFPSIGCHSCTRAVKPGEDIRAGRWWWEDEGKKECGLHYVDGRLVRKNVEPKGVLHG